MIPQVRMQSWPLRILLVEDEVLTRIALAEELRDAGVDVIEAVNGEEAWSYLRAGERVDLVFSDINVPGSMNGIELARRIRQHYPGLDVILTSGNPKPLSETWLGQFLPKPYAFAEAVSFILDTLARHRRAAM